MTNPAAPSGRLSSFDRLSIAFLTWRRLVQRRVAPYGITLKQAFVLHQLADRESLLPSEIAHLLFCDRPTATVIVRNMEKQGWVERQQAELDRRQKRVFLTPAGRAKLDELEERVWAPLVAAVDPLGGLTQKEREELDRLLAKLNRHLRQLE